MHMCIKSDIKRLAAAIVVLIALAAAATLFDHHSSSFERAEVLRVVDGDTLVVDRGRGPETVRLIGVDAPESVHPDPALNTDAGYKASDFLRDLLPDGTEVWLEKDVTELDRFGRLLRYVWIEPPSDGAGGSMVNLILTESGHAEPRRYPPDIKYAGDLEGSRL